MPHSIKWPDAQIGDTPCPFTRRSGARPLRLTFHTDALKSAVGDEVEALVALRELAHLEEIEALETEPGAASFLTIEPFQPTDDYIPVTGRRDEGTFYTGVDRPAQWMSLASELLRSHPAPAPTFDATLRDIITARAHHGLRFDILVTTSPILLANAKHFFIRDANPLAPSEAARIVGLYLRSRDIYTIIAGPGFRQSLDRGMFYWVLTRHRLPSMWKYFSACVHASIHFGKDVEGLGGTVLTRCVRALQARDAIGIEYYASDKAGSLEEMMYHFDYLALLLAGGFDSQARVAREVYGMTSIKPRNTSFRSKDFRASLQKHGGQSLFEIAADTHFQALSELLYRIRNTIHAETLRGISVVSAGRRGQSLIAVGTADAQAIWNAACTYDAAQLWGIEDSRNVRIEPYTFCLKLTRECMTWIDRVADRTDVRRLFPSSTLPPELLDAPPDGGEFREEIRRRIDLLG